MKKQAGGSTPSGTKQRRASCARTWVRAPPQQLEIHKQKMVRPSTHAPALDLTDEKYAKLTGEVGLPGITVINEASTENDFSCAFASGCQPVAQNVR